MQTDKTIYALGFFDGVHLGHQALLHACKELAQKHGCQAGVITFAAHPKSTISGRAPALITTLPDRRRLLEQQGMDVILTMPFDDNLRTMSWQDFFRLLIQEHHAAGLVCGDDFRFGYKGAGNAALLQQACDDAGIPCSVVPEQFVEGIRVSSTYIRTLLEQGDVARAKQFLGHPYILSGEVIPGRALGRTIGIPTANLLLPAELVTPKLGVYACKATVDGSQYLAVTNIGSRPTVGGHQVRAESWLLDFEGDLYGQALTLEFHCFLRPEQKFDSLEQLKAEIEKNAAQTRKFFENT